MRSRYTSRVGEIFAGSFAIVWIALFIAAIYGYFANIFAIVATVSDPITGMFIARLVGVFALPLGAILGWF